jgi:hypothetical protein
VRFQVLTAANVKLTAFWDIQPRSPLLLRFTDKTFICTSHFSVLLGTGVNGVRGRVVPASNLSTLVREEVMALSVVESLEVT